MHPAQRLLELRRMGYKIVSSWTWDVTPEGNLHRVGKYQLLPGGQMSLLDLLGRLKEGNDAGL
jgi:hypothetical protein